MDTLVPEPDQPDTPNLDELLNAAVPDLVPVKPLTEAELQFVTFMHQNYSLSGSILSIQAAEDLIGIESDEYTALMEDERILNALDERGVTIKVNTPVGSSNGKSGDDNVVSIKKWQEQVHLKSLTPVQLVVANTMLDLIDTRSQKKKLQDLNVSTTTYNTWLKDPVFQTYLRERAESMLGENQHEAHLALLDKVRMGDMKALEFYYEMTGQYTRASASQQNVASVAVDIQNLLVRIIEIINDEVDDPQVKMIIADRFKELMVARTIAGELVKPEIIVPEIAAARVITPELQDLMNKGEGYE
jgi:hypothetical protein